MEYVHGKVKRGSPPLLVARQAEGDRCSTLNVRGGWPAARARSRGVSAGYRLKDLAGVPRRWEEKEANKIGGSACGDATPRRWIRWGSDRSASRTDLSRQSSATDKSMIAPTAQAQRLAPPTIFTHAAEPTPARGAHLRGYRSASSVGASCFSHWVAADLGSRRSAPEYRHRSNRFPSKARRHILPSPTTPPSPGLSQWHVAHPEEEDSRRARTAGASLRRCRRGTRDERAVDTTSLSALTSRSTQYAQHTIRLHAATVQDTPPRKGPPGLIAMRPGPAWHMAHPPIELERPTPTDANPDTPSRHLPRRVAPSTPYCDTARGGGSARRAGTAADERGAGGRISISPPLS